MDKGNAIADKIEDTDSATDTGSMVMVRRLTRDMTGELMRSLMVYLPLRDHVMSTWTQRARGESRVGISLI